jgi:hypothetical protein
MPYGRGASATNSIQDCIQYCVAAEFTVAGTEYYNKCYCGNALANGATVAATDTECGMACAAERTRMRWS